ncbi:uncharacterized protein LOC124538637 isoform X2 [Vanessa cardui]|uniref:uncharacterized protein LOC124538637 isoform X2 n=1 Tax=Vanessa cardui TaxID=171605 RepID=UPI001F143FC5|nr:uncharacterized protein LOC124538637 isoform X2 [Vanessa cardui]
MSGSAQEDGTSVETGPTPAQDLYREKPPSTVVRVLTVCAYLLSVSLAAILLSIYYICVWKSPVITKANENEMYSSRRGDQSDYDPVFTYNNSPFNFPGGSNTPVNQTAIPPSLDDYTNATNTNETTEATINLIENPTLPTSPKDNETSTTHPKLNHTDTLNLTTVT